MPTFLAPARIEYCQIKGCQQLVSKHKRCPICGVGIGYGHVDEIPFGDGMCSGCYGLPLPFTSVAEEKRLRDKLRRYKVILQAYQRLGRNVERTASATGEDPRYIRRAVEWNRKRKTQA